MPTNIDTLSYWTKWLAQENELRLIALNASHVCQDILKTHQLTEKKALQFAESIVGGLLIASTHKENESVNLIVDHSGELRKQVVDATPEGTVRGYVVHKDAQSEEGFPPMLSVVYTKSHKNNWPYRGVVEFNQESMGEALMSFCMQSEQLITSAGIYVSETPQGLQASGILLQIVGGASTQDRQLVESISSKDLHIYAKQLALSDRFDPLQMKPLSKLNFKLMEHSPVTYKCPCNSDRMTRGLKMLPRTELEDIFSTQNPIVATCDFCLKQYRFMKEDVLA
ncbi:MAG: Hsp33 family molecular chaperone HslO [Bdellovibrionales bacterium]